MGEVLSPTTATTATTPDPTCTIDGLVKIPFKGLTLVGVSWVNENRILITTPSSVILWDVSHQYYWCCCCWGKLMRIIMIDVLLFAHISPFCSLCHNPTVITTTTTTTIVTTTTTTAPTYITTISPPPLPTLLPTAKKDVTHPND